MVLILIIMMRSAINNGQIELLLNYYNLLPNMKHRWVVRIIINLVDNEKIRDNRTYRGIDRPTDVISLPWRKQQG